MRDAFDLEEAQVSNPTATGAGEPGAGGRPDREIRFNSVFATCGSPWHGSPALFLADNSISLDAIVQSERQHDDGSRDISFILRKDDRARADVALAPLLANGPARPWRMERTSPASGRGRRDRHPEPPAVLRSLPMQASTSALPPAKSEPVALWPAGRHPGPAVVPPVLNWGR